MKRFFIVVLFLTSFFFLININTSYTRTSGNISAVTNAPGEGSCGNTNCHGAASLNGFGSCEIIFEEDITEYAPGETYQISVSTTDGAASLYGMQMVAIEGNPGANTSPSVGDFVTPVGMQIRTQGNRNYLTHQNTNNTTGDWTFEWIAPAAGTGSVTFYLAALAANDNGSKTGDQVYFDIYSLEEQAENLCPNLIEPQISIGGSCGLALFDIELSIEGAELPEEVDEVYFYYDVDSNFNPYNLDGTLLQKEDGLYQLVNNTCDPVDYFIKAALIAHEDGTVSNGPPEDEGCVPLLEVGTITVFPNLAWTGVVNVQECSVELNASCDNFIMGLTDQPDENGTGSFLVNLEEGTNEEVSINCFVVNPDGGFCLDTLFATFSQFITCDENCLAEKGSVQDTESEFCALGGIDEAEAVVINFAGQTETDDYEQLVIVSGEMDGIIKAYNTTGLFEAMEEGQYCVHLINYKVGFGPEIPAIGASLDLLSGGEGLCYDFDVSDCFSIGVNKCGIVDGLEKIEALSFNKLAINSGHLSLEISSQHNSDYKIHLYNNSGQLVYSDKMNLFIGENLLTYELQNTSSGLYFIKIFGETNEIVKKVLMK